jgi:hypothetical protein
MQIVTKQGEWNIQAFEQVKNVWTFLVLIIFKTK